MLALRLGTRSDDRVLLGKHCRALGKVQLNGGDINEEQVTKSEPGAADRKSFIFPYSVFAAPIA
jgi:hypothetical protein